MCKTKTEEECRNESETPCRERMKKRENEKERERMEKTEGKQTRPNSLIEHGKKTVKEVQEYKSRATSACHGQISVVAKSWPVKTVAT